MRDISLAQAMASRRTQREFSQQAVPLQVLQRMLGAAYGKTSKDGNLTVPSAHALRPLRLYVCAGRVEGVEQGVYAIPHGSQEMNLHIQQDVRNELQAAALEDQPWIADAAAIMTICADMAAVTTAFVEQPPYGTRGARYAHIEAGAAAQNTYLQAAAEGMACVLVAGFRDESTSEVLRLEAPIAPVLHMCFGWPAAA